jgi:hypothetical protein
MQFLFKDWMDVFNNKNKHWNEFFLVVDCIDPNDHL